MKAFTVLLILFFLIFLIASTGVAQVDLTPDTPPAAVNNSFTTIPETGGDDVIVIQGAQDLKDDTSVAVPVTGTCTDPYVVQEGDFISGIADLCGTTIAAIRQANPQITNINMIFPGQEIRIPAGAGVQAPPAAQPDVQPNVQPQAGQPDVEVPLPVTALEPMVQPGTPLEVVARYYPPNTQVNIAVGPQNTGYTIVGTGITDAQGSLTTTVIAPNNSNPEEPWVVVVATMDSPVIQAMSSPFYISTTQ